MLIWYTVLVYLHRNFFAQALYDHPIDPFRSQYAPSFLAAYESACTVLGALKDQFTMFPHEAARYWPLWTHAFSSAVSFLFYLYANHSQAF